MLITIITAIFTGVAAIFTGIAAGAAWSAAHQTRRAIAGGLISQLLDDYNSDEMLCAMRCLDEWKKEHGEEFALVFAEKRKTKYQEVKSVDSARRRVKLFFVKIYQLTEGELLPPKDIIRLLNQGQAYFALNYVEPLEKAINQRYDDRHFRFLDKVYAKLAPYRFEPNVPVDTA